MLVNNSFWNIVKKIEDQNHIHKSISIIKQCYSTYAPEEVFLSFNGGKDCTVLLYLTMYVLKSYYSYEGKLLCLYIRCPNPFPELESFIDQCEKLFNLEIVMANNGVKSGLGDILKDRLSLKACLMGTRRTDPYSENLEHFQPTDPGWPEVMRVSPILDWKYSEIWDFLLQTKASFCQLYNDGYTSLGDRSSTTRNPALKYIDPDSGSERYLPAWNLTDESQERCGRSRL